MDNAAGFSNKPTLNQRLKGYARFENRKSAEPSAKEGQKRSQPAAKREYTPLVSLPDAFIRVVPLQEAKALIPAAAVDKAQQKKLLRALLSRQEAAVGVALKAGAVLAYRQPDTDRPELYRTLKGHGFSFPEVAAYLGQPDVLHAFIRQLPKADLEALAPEAERLGWMMVAQRQAERISRYQKSWFTSPDSRLKNATKAGDLEKAFAAIAAGAWVNYPVNSLSLQHTPLTLAASQRRTDIAKALLLAGADVNSRGPAGYPALHQLPSDHPLFTLLLKLGANPAILDISNRDTTYGRYHNFKVSRAY